MSLSAAVCFFAAALVFVGGQECPTTIMTSDVRAAILNEHNRLRSSLALGKEPTLGGGYAKSAKNMYKMVYDCDIEKNAQEWANGCVFQHSPSEFRNAGENLYMSMGGSKDLKTNGLAACSSWWGELLKYGISDPDNILTADVFNSGVGHFTQMAWGKTTRIGCGIANNCTYQNWPAVMVVCEYRETGNYLNQVIYQLGTPCTKDADCTTFSGSTCSTTDRLCVKP